DRGAVRTRRLHHLLLFAGSTGTVGTDHSHVRGVVGDGDTQIGECLGDLVGADTADAHALPLREGQEVALVAQHGHGRVGHTLSRLRVLRAAHDLGRGRRVDGFGVQYAVFLLEGEDAQDGLVDAFLGQAALIHGRADAVDGGCGVGGHEELVDPGLHHAYGDLFVGVLLANTLHVEGVGGDHAVEAQFLTQDAVDDGGREGGRVGGVLTLQLRHEHVDRKSTRLNSSHVSISYAVFCLNKKK